MTNIRTNLFTPDVLALFFGGGSHYAYLSFNVYERRYCIHYLGVLKRQGGYDLQ